MSCDCAMCQMYEKQKEFVKELSYSPTAMPSESDGMAEWLSGLSHSSQTLCPVPHSENIKIKDQINHLFKIPEHPMNDMLVRYLLIHPSATSKITKELTPHYFDKDANRLVKGRIGYLWGAEVFENPNQGINEIRAISIIEKTSERLSKWKPKSDAYAMVNMFLWMENIK